MGEIVEKTFLITAREADLNGFCRPSSLLEFLQDIAVAHATNLGLGRDVLLERYGAFWMMARLEYRLNRPIRHMEALTVQTWQRPAKGVTVFRDFALSVEGEPVGEAVTSWVIAAAADRRILRPRDLPEYLASAKREGAADRRPQRILPTGELEAVERRTVRYSDADLNGHMNNVRYGDIVCDAIDYGGLRGQFLSQLGIHYLRECFLGETLDIFRGRDGGRHFVRGTDSAGQGRFDAALTLSPM